MTIGKIDAPYVYEIEPTNFCPYKCIMCPRGLGHMDRKVGYMDIDTFLKILLIFPEKQKLVRLHHFGEAILHPDIDLMLRMISQKGLISVISLNPASLNPRLIKKILSGSPKVVCFSHDAFSSSGLKAIRGIDRSYEQCLEMMDLFILESRKLSYSVLKVIQTVALDANENEYNNISMLKEQYPEDDVLFYAAENTGFGDLSLVEKTKNGGSEVLIENAKPCGAPFSEVSILWNGDVVLCCYDYNGVNVIGNINKNSIEEIWSSSKVEQIRDSFQKHSTSSLMLCSRCYLAPHNFPNQVPIVKKAWNEEADFLELIS